jgi:hypothetical protein
MCKAQEVQKFFRCTKPVTEESLQWFISWRFDGLWVNFAQHSSVRLWRVRVHRGEGLVST